MRTDHIRSLKDLDKAIDSLDRKMDRTETAINQDVNHLLDFPTHFRSGFYAVKALFKKKKSE